MIQRIIPAVIGVTLLISGCAKKPEPQGVTDFSVGATLLKIAHLPSPTADGSGLFITVDGKEAGALPVGEAMLLQVPAGEHQVGGYARSLVGRVTIPSLKVTTAADQPRFVAYRVARNTPLFSERGIDPLPKSAPIPEKQVGQSESVPVPQLTQLSLPESTPEIVQSESSEVATPANSEEPPKTATSTDTETVVAPAESKATVIAPSSVSADALWLPTESPATEIPKPAETPKPTETPKPAETLKPTETPKPAETLKPAEAPKQTEAAVSETSVP